MIPPTENQREHPRRVARLAARVVFSAGHLDGTIENIAEGGAFFVTDTWEVAVEEGDGVSVEFREAEDAEPARVAGRVLRVERYFHEGDLYRAFAIKFEEPYPA